MFKTFIRCVLIKVFLYIDCPRKSLSISKKKGSIFENFKVKTSSNHKKEQSIFNKTDQFEALKKKKLHVVHKTLRVPKVVHKTSLLSDKKECVPDDEKSEGD